MINGVFRNNDVSWDDIDVDDGNEDCLLTSQVKLTIGYIQRTVSYHNESHVMEIERLLWPHMQYWN